MTRSLWIAALASALVCFVGGSAFYATSRLAHGNIGLVGWFVLASSAVLLWVAVRYLCFCVGEAIHGTHAEPASRSHSAESEPLRG